MAPEATMESKKMYHVEKFLPPECPKCRHKFLHEGDDWTLLLGDIVNGQKKIRETKGYTIIICRECRNYTPKVLLETYQLDSKEKAMKMLDNGFVNLLECEAMGDNTYTQDSHTVYQNMPQTEVKAVHV